MVRPVNVISSRIEALVDLRDQALRRQRDTTVYGNRCACREQINEF
jgi:hypothetical protein